MMEQIIKKLSFLKGNRMTKKITNSVVTLLEENDVIIHNVERKKVGFFIDADNVLIHITKDCIQVAFHVSVRADDSAVLALMIQDEIGVSVKIGEVYCVRTDGKNQYYIGDEAFEFWEMQKQTMVIQRFINEKNLIDWFIKAENCGTA